MRRGRFVFFLLLLALSNIAFVVPVHHLDRLILQDDHPKFFSISVENAEALLKHGYPFGYNHNFQGGIPAFYLRSCFLPLVPFSSVLGERLGYQTLMSDQFVLGCAVAAVTDNAANLTMCTLDKLGILQEDLLPYLQRRQLSCSAFARGCL